MFYVLRKILMSWYDIFSDTSIDLASRLFVLCSASAGMMLYIAAAHSVYRGESVVYGAVIALSGAAFHLLYAVSIFTHRYALYAALSSIYMITVIEPGSFFINGGPIGGAPIWFFMMMMYILLVNRGMKRIILTLGGVVSAVISYVVGYYDPDLIQEMSRREIFISSCVSLVCVFTVSLLLVRRAIRVIIQERKLVNEQKEEIEHLVAAQGVFFSKMSHEIRTPINAIIGLNELTLRSKDHADVQKNSESIRNASRLLLSIVNDVIDVSKIRFRAMQIEPAQYDVAKMIASVVDVDRQLALDKGLAFDVVIDGEVPRMMIGDSGRIQQILVNLLSNAIKYTQSGSVTLTVRADAQGGDDVMLIVEVADTGAGIKHEDMATLFSLFGRVDRVSNREVEGSGLGLSIVKDLLDLMGGTISVDSVFTKGSTFRADIPQKRVGDALLLPADIDDQRAEDHGPSREGTASARQYRLLVVDDNEMNRQVARDLLALSGFEADGADSGREALEMTSQRAYDAILMDHFMPEMDGVETMTLIRSQEGGQNRSTPIIVLTANADQGEDYYRRAGFDGYLTKPIMPEELVSAIEEIIPGHWPDIAVGEKKISIDRKVRHKRRIMITTESVGDLTYAMREEYGIGVLPVYIETNDGHRYMDEREIDGLALENYLAVPGSSAATASPAVEDYERFFADCLMEAERVIHISMASADPGNEFSEAVKAASVFGSVDVVSSGAVSISQGLIAYLAAKRAVEERMGRDGILDYIDSLKKDIESQFLLGDVDQIASTGRVSTKFRGLCRALMLHPAVKYKKDRLSLRGVYIGTLASARKKFVANVAERGDIGASLVLFGHAGIAKSEVEELCAAIKRYARECVVRPVRLSAGVFANAGAGTIGISYVRGVGVR